MICRTRAETDEALNLAARIADAEDPDCERLLFGEGPQVCDVLRCEVLRQADVIDHLDALLARQHAILTGVADALRGDPGPLASHSHHDLAERAAAVVRERDALRDAVQEYLDARHKALVATLAYLDADPADAAARDAASASEARVTAARTRLTTLADDTTMRAR